MERWRGSRAERVSGGHQPGCHFNFEVDQPDQGPGQGAVTVIVTDNSAPDISRQSRWQHQTGLRPAAFQGPTREPSPGAASCRQLNDGVKYLAAFY